MPELDFRTMQTLPQRVKRSRKSTPTESPSARSSTVPRPGGRSSSPRCSGPMPFGMPGCRAETLSRPCSRSHWSRTMCGSPAAG
jgi:hypothetical protein